ncbi:NAD(P)-binding domain-containing protein [Streptomyces sp. NPDC048106]|uniref:shikimate dehydrogenase family protein n=1 Tax=Streptomyces sp. NPDC048106 TaxID=3155750 RepID=UPI00345688B7
MPVPAAFDDMDSPAVSGRPEIRGTTRLYAVLGCPVAQVKAPGMLNPLFARLGVDAVLVPVLAEPGHLGEIVRGLQRMGNVDGLLVTVPHKAEVRAYADTVSAAAEQSGGANALRREPDGTWYADNFDGAGFVAGLRTAGFDPAGVRVSVVGAGGAGGALVPALLAAGAEHVAVCDPRPERLQALSGRLGAAWPGRFSCSAAPGFEAADLVVNATPLGMRADDPLPFDPGRLPEGAVVADIIMQPRETALLRAAAERGLRIHHGEHMLSHQIPLYREFFRLDPVI